MRPPAMSLKAALESALHRAGAEWDGTVPAGGRVIAEPRMGLAEAMRIVQRRHAEHCGDPACDEGLRPARLTVPVKGLS